MAVGIAVGTLAVLPTAINAVITPLVAILAIGALCTKTYDPVVGNRAVGRPVSIPRRLPPRG
jgi:hypothetical protein